MPDFNERLQDLLTRLRGNIGSLGIPDRKIREEIICHSQQRLLQLTQRMMRRYPNVRHWEDVNDVLQNVLLRLDRAILAVRLVLPGDFLRLAKSLIRRELIDLSRRYSGPRGLAKYFVPQGSVAEARILCQPSDLDGDPSLLDWWQNFHDQIAGLEKGDRELFGLLFYDGLTQPAAAARLNMPLRSFKRRWQAAQSLLRRRLEGELPF